MPDLSDVEVARRYLRERARREAGEYDHTPPDRLSYADPTGNTAVRNLERWQKEKKALKKFQLPEGQMTEHPTH